MLSIALSIVLIVLSKRFGRIVVAFCNACWWHKTDKLTLFSVNIFSILLSISSHILQRLYLLINLFLLLYRLHCAV